jgi:hypothetical protein
MKHIQTYESFKKIYNESSKSLNEERSVEKIQRELSLVQKDIKQMLARYKANITNPKEKLDIVSTLKDLNARKKQLDAKLNSAIETMYSDAELEDMGEGLMIPEFNKIQESEINDIYILAKEAKTLNEFISLFKREFDFGDLVNEKDLGDWLKTVYTQSAEKTLIERELADQTIFDLWEEVYGENFIKEYPKMAKIIKTRPNIDRGEFARIWGEVYEEDFEEKHSELWGRLE